MEGRGKEMFDLCFGFIWVVVSSIGLGAVFSLPKSERPTPAIVMIIMFLIIGIVIMVIGIKKLVSNMLTEIKGIETYGVIMDIYPSGASVNGRNIMNVDVNIVEENGNIGRYTESIGTGRKYNTGDFVKVKYYKYDINIKGKVRKEEIPYYTLEKISVEDEIINRPVGDSIVINGDTIVVNGVEYVRKQ